MAQQAKQHGGHTQRADAQNGMRLEDIALALFAASPDVPGRTTQHVAETCFDRAEIFFEVYSRRKRGANTKG